MVVALAAAPEWTVDFRVVVGGKHPAPEGSSVYGKVYPPHPLTMVLWKAAGQATTPFLVARTPTLAPGTRAVGERPDEVRSVASLGDALDWIESEAKRIHAERWPTYRYVTGKDGRAAVAVEQAAKFERARLEGEKKRAEEAAAKAQVEAQKVGWTVRRGHRVLKP
jgi:hypothetical protein